MKLNCVPTSRAAATVITATSPAINAYSISDEPLHETNGRNRAAGLGKTKRFRLQPIYANRWNILANRELIQVNTAGKALCGACLAAIDDGGARLIGQGWNPFATR